MSFQIGDHIRFLDEPLKGKVIHKDGSLLTILTEDDFELQCQTKEVILDQSFNHKTTALPQQGSMPKRTNSTTKKGVKGLVIDLHIHELIDNEKGLSKHDKLLIQLKEVERVMKQALAKRVNKVVFIHGIGKGVLRDAVHKTLKKYPVEFFEASYKDYGQGATEVRLYQNPK